MMSQLKQKRSPVLEYFELVDAGQDGKKVKEARCKLCKDTQLAYKGSTTNMINHIQAKHRSAYQESFQSTSSSSTRQATLSLVNKKCSPAHSKEIDELVSDFIAKDLRPIAIVDGPGFKNLVHFLEPGYKVPSRTHVMSTLRKKYDALKKELVVPISSHYLAITTDIWTSRATEAYITITAHYIDDDSKLISNVLTTEAMPERHTGVNFAERIREAMNK